MFRRRLTMNETTLLYVMTAFVIISAIALCIQAGMLAGFIKPPRRCRRKSILCCQRWRVWWKDQCDRGAERRQITEITTRANDILDSTKRQLAIVEDVVGDAAVRAKVQMERVELVLDDTLSRAHETVAVVHDGVMRPLAGGQRAGGGHAGGVGALARGIGRLRTGPPATKRCLSEN
jgi:hypothetical protein